MAKLIRSFNSSLLLCAFALTVCAQPQTSEVDRLASVIRMKMEAEKRSSDLDWLKVALGPLVTLIVSGFGAYYLQRQSSKQTQRLTTFEKSLESKLWANQKLIEKRLAVFDTVAPLLNDLYCFMIRVGVWRDVTPEVALNAKRSLDRQMYIYQALFPESVRQAYFAYIHCCFRTFTGVGEDAKIVAELDIERQKLNWDPKWVKMLSDPTKRPHVGEYTVYEDAAEHRECVRRTYDEVMSSFANAVGVFDQAGQPTA